MCLAPKMPSAPKMPEPPPPPPTPVTPTVPTTVKPRTSRKESQLSAKRGTSSLTIPLSTGGATTSRTGLNIGS